MVCSYGNARALGVKKLQKCSRTHAHVMPFDAVRKLPRGARTPMISRRCASPTPSVRTATRTVTARSRCYSLRPCLPGTLGTWFKVAHHLAHHLARARWFAWCGRGAAVVRSWCGRGALRFGTLALRELVAPRGGGRIGKAQPCTSSSKRCDGCVKKPFSLHERSPVEFSSSRRSQCRRASHEREPSRCFGAPERKNARHLARCFFDGQPDPLLWQTRKEPTSQDR